MGQKEIDDYRAQIQIKRRRMVDEALEEPEPNLDDESEVDMREHEALLTSPEPWNVVVMNPETGVPEYVDSAAQLMRYLELEKIELRDFLLTPKAEHARLSGRYPWLEGLYAGTRL